MSLNPALWSGKRWVRVISRVWLELGKILWMARPSAGSPMRSMSPEQMVAWVPMWISLYLMEELPELMTRIFTLLTSSI